MQNIANDSNNTKQSEYFFEYNINIKFIYVYK